jgi:hypothetical protein
VNWIGATELAKPSIVRLFVQIEHVRIETAKSFADVKAALEDLVPPLDPAIPEALRQGDIERANEALQRGPELAIFSVRDHGGLLRIAGLARKALQYEIGNPLTASRMTRHVLPAAHCSANSMTSGSQQSGGNWMRSLKACWSRRPAKEESSDYEN